MVTFKQPILYLVHGRDIDTNRSVQLLTIMAIVVAGFILDFLTNFPAGEAAGCERRRVKRIREASSFTYRFPDVGSGARDPAT